jgi:hypothetical protein
MMINKINQLIFLISLTASCAFFVKRIETPLISKEDYIKSIPQIKTYCPIEQKSTIQITGSSGNSQSVYLDMIQKMGKKLDVFDHLALWGLTQLSVRPDQSTPSARLQILVHNQDKTHYFDFYSESNDDQYPYLYGIEWILKKFGKHQRLEYYAQILNSSLGENLLIGKDLESFLIQNQQKIKINAELTPYFFRGTEILKENESTPSLDYAKVIAEYRKVQNKQKIIIGSSLTPFVTEQGRLGSCNYDFNLYKNSIFLIDKVIPVANLFGLAGTSGSFMASSSQKLDQMQSLKGFPLFKGESKVRSSAVCIIEKEQDKIWTFSNQSRDPGQHLFHLVRYGLLNSSSVSDVDRLLRYSRHLLLSDPLRLIIESQRSTKNQLEEILKLDLPSYNAQSLGNIWAYTFFSNQSRFIIDDRNPGSFACK